ncbi:MAG: peroxidase family protein [Phycisphaerales bacterium]
MRFRPCLRLAALSTLILCAGQAAGQNRSIDGTGNNIAHSVWGSAGSDLRRGPSGAHYMDGLGMMMPRANPRAVSNALSGQSPAGLGNNRLLSSMFWQWGQFIDHDFALVDESSAEPAPIAVPAGDPVMDPGGTGTQVMSFNRSVCSDGITGPRQHQNVLTHWIDGSMVYGSDTGRASALRAGTGGRLAVSAGDMLPFNTSGLPNGGGTSSSLFLAGDVRANEQTGLLAMHTLFVREHNRIAGQVAAANPGWTDEQIYQKARKIVGAQVQAITYNEWLPALLGPHGLSAYSGYNQAVDPSIDTAFSTAAFRIGHTMLNDQLPRYNEDGSVYSGGHLNLFQAFFQPSTITGPGALDAALRGLARQQANEIDTQVIDSVRNLLFGPSGGRDLVALNLQRGRDHGLPDYNTLRADYGLLPISNFAQITSDPSLAATLSAVYGGDVNAVDPWIGLMAEDHLPGASVGETVAAIFRDQFERLRLGDRFFYLNDADLTAQDLALIESTRLADIIRANTGIFSIQDNVFFVIPAPGAGSTLAAAGLLAARRRRRRGT